MIFNKEKREITLERELSDLDKLVLKYIGVLSKHVDYVIISGYVSILLGRSRSTEDVDVFIKKMSEESFLILYKDLVNNGFWCLNAEDGKEVFNYLKDGFAVRFSIEGKPVPNFEIKFPKDFLDNEAFEDCIDVILPAGKIKISSLERHLAFKRYFLKSQKDLEDALHVEELFKDKIDYHKINKLKELIKIRLKNGR